MFTGISYIVAKKKSSFDIPWTWNPHGFRKFIDKNRQTINRSLTRTNIKEFVARAWKPSVYISRYEYKNVARRWQIIPQGTLHYAQRSIKCTLMTSIWTTYDFKLSLFYGTYKSSSYVCLCISIFRYFMTIKYTIFLWIRKWVVCDVVIGCSFFLNDKIK